MSKILITGGAGFIGSSLADRLLIDPEFTVVLADNLLTGDMKKVPQHPRCSFLKCDVNDYDELAPLMESNRFDFVFHFAAVVGVKRTIENPLMVLRDLEGIKNVLELSKSTGVKRVFYSSSSEVYGEPFELPQHEQTTPLNSRLPYAVVKNAGESFCRSYQKEFGLNYTIFRFFNTYGKKQSDDFVISKFISLAMAGSPITIFGDGKQTRTFCYIEDNTELIYRVLKDGLCINDVMNVGSEIEITIVDLAKAVLAEMKSQSSIVFMPPLAEGDMTRRCPDNSRMKSILRRELTPLTTGIRHILKSRMTSKISESV